MPATSPATENSVGPKAVADRVREVIGDATCYLSFDVDALDPAFAPGTGTPEVGGIATWQARAILRRLAGLAFVGMDVVEVSPPYDVNDNTAQLAARIILDVLGTLVAHGHLGHRNKVMK